MGLRPDHEIFEEAASWVAEAANDADRRQHGRALRVMRVARLADDQAEGLGMVRDVSSGGMKIDAYIPLEIGQDVSIALLDDQQLTGTVIWKDEQSVGVQFAVPVPVESILAKPLLRPDGKRARMPRLAIDRAVTVEHGNARLPSRICDMSQRGAKMLCSANIPMHSNIRLFASGALRVMATVKWRGGEYMGVEFHRLLPVEELALWIKGD